MKNKGDKVKANVAYKFVPYVKCKVQEVEINFIDHDYMGAYYGGLNEKGKQVYFREADIQS